MGFSPRTPGALYLFGTALPRKNPSCAFMRSSGSAGKALNIDLLSADFLRACL
jgi:hypothetical protein